MYLFAHAIWVLSLMLKTFILTFVNLPFWPLFPTLVLKVKCSCSQSNLLMLSSNRTYLFLCDYIYKRLQVSAVA